jgi:hypothetical protein
MAQLPRPARRPIPRPTTEASVTHDDELGAGVESEAPEGEENGESEEVETPAVIDELDSENPPFPEDYVPQTISEATRLEQWRGRHHLRHFHDRHNAELEAGKRSVLEAERVLNDQERIAEEQERRRLEAELARAEEQLSAAKMRLTGDPSWLVERENGERFE